MEYCIEKVNLYIKKSGTAESTLKISKLLKYREIHENLVHFQWNDVSDTYYSDGPFVHNKTKQKSVLM